MTTTQKPHAIDNALVGRAWVALDDVPIVLGFTAAGMCRVQRGDGRVQQISPDIVREALARTGIPVASEAEAARQAEVTDAMNAEFAADDELQAILARVSARI